MDRDFDGSECRYAKSVSSVLWFGRWLWTGWGEVEGGVVFCYKSNVDWRESDYF